jgi:hypothetical protein
MKPKYTERNKRRWADPEQRLLMLEYLQKAREALKAKRFTGSYRSRHTQRKVSSKQLI